MPSPDAGDGSSKGAISPTATAGRLMNGRTASLLKTLTCREITPQQRTFPESRSPAPLRWDWYRHAVPNESGTPASRDTRSQPAVGITNNNTRDFYSPPGTTARGSGKNYAVGRLRQSPSPGPCLWKPDIAQCGRDPALPLLLRGRPDVRHFLWTRADHRTGNPSGAWHGAPCYGLSRP